MIEHDVNGPFIRAVRAAGEGQTETVHAIRVRYATGAVEYWNPQPEAFDKAEVDETRQTAYRFTSRGRVMEVDAVKREVTISASEWESDTPIER